MERMGPGNARHDDEGRNPAGRTVAAARAAAVTAAAAVLLAGCSVTVQPKNAAAARTLAPSTPSASAATPATPSADPTPTPDKPASTPSVGKDVDHTACTAVRQALLTAQQKVETDKDSPRRMGQDYKTAATALRTQATKTKNSELKSTLETLGTAYSALGTDTTAHASTEADQKKVAEASKPLDTLCGAKS
ncbi:hypothetical protein [Catenulispora subtropica]|uniref:Lipoprotein n=1 Tax=Catenulispora subtropica TaxID=450798 RepID=A0ABP5DH96_9ACTN